MTLLLIFLKGMAIGFSIAAPVGPIAFLCIRTTLARGRAAGLAIGAGAAFADSTYALLGITSLNLVSNIISQYALPLRIIGGVFLLFLGIRTILAKTDTREGPKISGARLFKSFSASFFLTLTNPATIFCFIAAFAAFGLHFENYIFPATLVAGVFTGSLAWWLVLCFSVAHVSRKINEEHLHKLNLVAGAAIAAFGIAALISAFWLV
ncbi:MAG: LysE family transporter [Alphaproteobacteria bacterium]|nr:LysE family transporter [Alphaproteobacteria bacterium]